MRNIESLNALLKRWLFWDGDLYAELDENELRILEYRLVNRQSFDIVAIQLDVNEIQAKMLFDNILLKLQRAYGNQVVDLLIELDDEIESYIRKRNSRFGFDYMNIPLN